MRSRLLRVPLPDEQGARERAWRVVSAAHAGREPAPRHRRRAWPLALAAAAIAVVAAALTPPGRAVLDSIRRAVGVEHAQTELFALPAPGRLLVDSAAGPWIVEQDGSRRLLGRYREASWSPHGLYVAATRRDELLALDPKGTVRWSLARPAVRFPRWTGTRTDTRIAYVSGNRLRLVGGDSKGDGPLCGRRPAAAVAPAWRPGHGRVLAYATPEGRVLIVDADTCSVAGSVTAGAVPTGLDWSDDGQKLLVLSASSLRIVDAHGRLLHDEMPAPGTRLLDAAFVLGSHRFAEVRRNAAGSSVYIAGRLLFRGTGVFRDIAWSPDGHWLLVTWPTADQWVFIRSSGARRIVAASNIGRQFGGSFPRVAGWCCR